MIRYCPICLEEIRPATPMMNDEDKLENTWGHVTGPLEGLWPSGPGTWGWSCRYAWLWESELYDPTIRRVREFA